MGDDGKANRVSRRNCPSFEVKSGTQVDPKRSPIPQGSEDPGNAPPRGAQSRKGCSHGTFLYLIGFVGNLVVPKSIDTGSTTNVIVAFLINFALIALFGIQHSVMARPGFKARWQRYIPASIERSTYALLASVVLMLLFWVWRPMEQVIWDIQGRGHNI